MNKKLLLSVTGTVILCLLVLWTLLRGVTWTSTVVPSIIAGALSLIGFPIRLYVILVLGENGSWSIPVLVFLLLITGLIWGVIIERIASFAKRWRRLDV